MPYYCLPALYSLAVPSIYNADDVLYSSSSFRERGSLLLYDCIFIFVYLRYIFANFGVDVESILYRITHEQSQL